MSEQTEHHHRENVQQALAEIQHLLARHRLVEGLVHRQAMPRHELVETLVHKQHVAELVRRLDAMHAADIAFVLEALPLDDRLFVWDLVKAERDGEILLEVSDPVRESLIESREPKDLVAAAEQLDADELADLAPDLPRGVMEDVFRLLGAEEREQLRAAMSYPEDAVGALMDFDLVTVREDVSLEVVLRYLRRFDELPDHTDQIYVVDRQEHLRGVLPLARLLVADPEARVADVMLTNPLRLTAEDKADEASRWFERYDLVSAAVVDAAGRLVGRVTVDSVLDFVREQQEAERLAQAGLREEEDIFAGVWVALATLMPIVAGIGGNSGNQTITMIVRAIALGQVRTDAARKLYRKEIAVAIVNGVIWGGLLGILAWGLYGSISLGLVLTMAMLLNLLLAAIVGVAVPMTLSRLGRDPAVGSSVMITAVTDSGGFFIFLGLATLFLIK
ncbi:MAG TPA: magnesium transporter [Rhodocyclaceae bacterium]|nr:magnesium transporter [Rhodocyclaceae bacterium]